MNEQQYRKQLLVQQIDAHRGLMRLELERAKDLNPVQPFIDLGRQIHGVAGGLLRSEGRGSVSSAIALPWNLNLNVILPFVIKLATSLLKRKKGRK
jgi:hypothetical protein